MIQADLVIFCLTSPVSTGSRARNTFPTPPPTTRGGVFVDRKQVAMPRSDKPLRDQITAAATELKLARRDGSAEWIKKSAKALDELLDQIPRTTQHSDVR